MAEAEAEVEPESGVSARGTAILWLRRDLRLSDHCALAGITIA
jgi:hypothetical protein